MLINLLEIGSIYATKQSLYWQKMNFNYQFRKTPVPHTRKWRGGSNYRNPHTAKIMRMYKNPEYKNFNRGSYHEIPTWWDEKMRDPQRSWKVQSKCRHQWEAHVIQKEKKCLKMLKKNLK